MSWQDSPQCPSELPVERHGDVFHVNVGIGRRTRAFLHNSTQSFVRKRSVHSFVSPKALRGSPLTLRTLPYCVVNDSLVLRHFHRVRPLIVRLP